MQQETTLDVGHHMDVFRIPEMNPELLDTFRGFTQQQSDNIRLFMDTYSAIHVSGFTVEEKARLREKLWYNKVLVKLLDNLDVPKTYAVDYIEEPISIKIYQFNNKTVYIFGEQHRDTFGHCASSIAGGGWPPRHVPAAYVPPRDITGTIIGGMQNEPAQPLPAQPPPVPAPQLSYPFIPPGTRTLRFDEWLNQLRQLTPSFFDLYMEASLEELEQPLTSVVPTINEEFIDVYVGAKRMEYMVTDVLNNGIDPRPYIFDTRMMSLPTIHNSGYTHISRIFINDRLNDPVLGLPPLPPLPPLPLPATHPYVLLPPGIHPVIIPNHFRIDHRSNHILNMINILRNSYKTFNLTGNNIQLITPNHGMYNFRNKFRNCFIPSTRKTLPNFEACRLARFHSVDARYIDIGIGQSITPIQIGYGIQGFLRQGKIIEGQDIVDIHTEVNTLDFLRTLMIPRHHLPPNTPLVWPPSPVGLLPLPAIIPVLYDAFGNIIPQPLPPIPAPPVPVDMYAQNMFDYILSIFPQVAKEYSRSYYKDEIRQRIVHNLLLPMYAQPQVINFNELIHQAIFVLHQPYVNPQETLTILEDLNIYFFFLSALIMDIYCLSRVFKKFKLRTDCQPAETNNIIIYAGDLHARLYSEFIENELGHAPIYNERTVSSPDYSCVRINLSSIIAGLNIR